MIFSGAIANAQHAELAIHSKCIMFFRSICVAIWSLWNRTSSRYAATVTSTSGI